MHRVLALATTALFATAMGCATPAPQPKADSLSVARVQGEIEVGLDSASVAEILGSPNIITTDEKRREVWIYDKISTDRVDTSQGFGGTIIILGGSTQSHRSSTTQKTLTIIIKYDNEMRVRDYAYNYSQF